MIWRCLILCGVLLFPGAASAEYEDLTAMEIYRLAVDAYQEGDAQGFLVAMEEMNRRHPYQFLAQYNYTSALVGAGEIEAAILRLERLADLGMSIDLAADEDFVPLYDHPRFDFLSARLMLNAGPDGISEVLYEFDQTDVMPEGVAIDERTGDTFISTVRSGQIFKRSADGELSVFADGTSHAAMAGILGMAVDAPRGLLWATTSTPEQYNGANVETASGSALMGFDLETGEVRHALVVAGYGHFLGEVVIAPDGNVYASDSRRPRLYRVRDDLTGLLSIGLEEGLTNLQGIAFAPDGRLYLADYGLGLFMVDVATGEHQALELADGINPTGVDGLFFVDGDLVAIQNGSYPKRIVRFELDEDGVAITGLEVLVNNHPLWDEPTLGQIVGDQLIYVATAEWPDYDLLGDRYEGAAMDPIRIMSVDLN